MRNMECRNFLSRNILHAEWQTHLISLSPMLDEGRKKCVCFHFRPISGQDISWVKINGLDQNVYYANLSLWLAIKWKQTHFLRPSSHWAMKNRPPLVKWKSGPLNRQLHMEYSCEIPRFSNNFPQELVNKCTADQGETWKSPGIF